MYGFGIAGFRSFGPDPQYVAPLGKINVLVGQNNVGKSNVLRALRTIAWGSGTKRSDGRPFSDDDRHRGARQAELQLFMPVPVADEALSAYVATFVGPGHSRAANFLQEIFRGLPIQKQGAAWFSHSFAQGRAVLGPSVEELRVKQDRSTGEKIAAGVEAREWAHVWHKLTGHGSGSLEQHWIPEVLSRVSPFARTPVPEIHTVEPFRQIGEPGTQYTGLNGTGLIARLEELQSPERERWNDRKKFDAILSFVRDVTGCPDAMLHIPHSAKQLNVEMGERILPIEALGTGIHQVIIFAAAATAYDGVFMCFEEPEIHMHPRLQKRLLSYLQQTSNRYLITTHSPHFLDAEGIERFHVTLNEYGETQIQHIDTPSGRASICFDLGYRPSDLVQANCVMWVEGPSDRIYLNAWIRAVDPSLREGEHYSIMFYGGRLLSHLEVSDAEIQDFIELQRLNRRVAIVMDSDKRNKAAEINATKSRVGDETSSHGGFAWVTEGREVENYIKPDIMESALRAVHPTMTFKPAINQWACAYDRRTGKTEGVDKIKVAKVAVETVELDRLDLRIRINQLVEFIRRSND